MPVLLLDPYHLGDPLFVTGLARDLAARRGGLVLVHGSGERGERALEASGAVPREVDGVWAVETDGEAETVERTTRELNREIAHELNEAGVASTRLVGADRGLLKGDGAGGVHVGRSGWLAELVGRGVVAVVAALVAAPGAPALREVEAGRAAAALAGALAEPVLVLRRGRLDAQPDGPLSLGDGAVRAALGAPEAARRALAEGARVVAVDRAALRADGPVEGLDLTS